VHTFTEKHKQRLDYSVLLYGLQFQNIFSANTLAISCSVNLLGYDTAVPLRAWNGPDGSRHLRFPDFLSTAQDGGKDVSATHRQHLPPRK
jgi:hypothetical protein